MTDLANSLVLSHDRPFASFWIAGFEGADHVNGQGTPLDLSLASGHARQFRGDYRRARALGIATVRESVGWRIAGASHVIDAARAIAYAREAQRQGIEIVWTLWHYGMPDGLDPFDASVVPHFAKFAANVARALRPYLPADAWFNPVNEISFTCWLYTEGRTGAAWTGEAASRARRLKENLARAALQATRAIRDVMPEARFLHVDPVIHAVAPPDDPALSAEAQGQIDSQWQAWDLLCDPAFEPSIARDDRVQMLGINHYHSSQWTVPSRKPLRWHLRDPRRRALADLCAAVHRRYALPFMIAETSHVGSGRGDWIRDVGAEILRMRERSLPIRAACVYPFVNRPDWDRPDVWHASGLYDVVPRGHANGGRRRPNRDYCDAFRAALGPAQALRGSESREEGNRMDALVVFSHLRWDSVWQRPQQLVTRFAKRFRVLFVEEPCFEEGPPRGELMRVSSSVTVLRPHTAIHAGGFHDEQLPALRALLRDALAELRIDRYGVYTFTPMALPLMQDLAPDVIAYDCMDELAAFKHAARQLPQRESALLKVANVVFTGGPSLYRGKLPHHPSVHCFPSSVDGAHFATARRDAHVHADVAKLPHPRLGFYGVIDERFDIELVRAIARARPEWQFVFVGPVVKIDAAALPREPNVHWLPQQPYEHLPALIAGWDVCLLPFARNEHTRCISPTKTLEYLAADKPVVSTPIADVVELYGSVVYFGDEAESFVDACERLLNESGEDRDARIAATRALVERTSWDATASAMADLVVEASHHGLRGEARTLLAGTPARRAAGRPRDAECLVLGAGPTGLSTSLHYGANATLLEREATVGGWCRSIVDRGFTFDCAGHIMFSQDAGVLELYRRLLGDNVVWQDREAWIFSKGVYTRYPFQGSLHGLPADVLKECVLGAIEARYGALDGRRATMQDDCCADGTDVAGIVDGCVRPAVMPPDNFEAFIYATWGRGIAKHFAIPYNRKLWTYPLTEMETSWLGGRVPLPDLEQMIEGALKPSPRPMGPNARFGYPRRGGFQALMDGFLPLLQGPLELEAEIVQVSPAKRQVMLGDGRVYRYGTLVSTVPLPELVRATDEAPAEIRAAASRLRRVSVRCVNFGIGREALSDKHWIYYPEDTVFHRVFLQGNASAANNAPGGFALTCEISYSDVKPLPAVGSALIERCRRDLVRVGLIRENDPVVTANEVDMPYAYVLYDHQREAAVRRIREWYTRHNVLLAGRYSEWAYYNSDHAFVAGREAARSAQALMAGAREDARIA